MTDDRSEVFDRVLQAERQRNVNYLNLARFVAVSVFLALRCGADYFIPHPKSWAFPWVLLGYWLVSGLLFAGARQSARLAHLSALAVPFLDMPAVFLSQWLDMPFSDAPRAVANFTLSGSVLLVMLSAFMLKHRQVIVAGCVATCLHLGLGFQAGDSYLGRFGGVVVLGVGVAIACFALARRIQMAHALAEEELQRERLRRYFSPEVAARIQQSGLGFAAGQQHVVTVLFADLRQFTALSERLPPAEAVALLNEFQACMVAEVFAHRGTLDKFLGDGLMAYFGAPMAQADHPWLALRCAMAMQSALAKLNAARAARDEAPLRMGVGVHTGVAIVGAIGSESRREYTVVGDTVNVAARIENLTRRYDEDILLSGETAQHLGDTVLLRAVDEAAVRGRSQPVRLFAPARG